MDSNYVKSTFLVNESAKIGTPPRVELISLALMFIMNNYLSSKSEATSFNEESHVTFFSNVF